MQKKWKVYTQRELGGLHFKMKKMSKSRFHGYQRSPVRADTRNSVSFEQSSVEELRENFREEPILPGFKLDPMPPWQEAGAHPEAQSPTSAIHPQLAMPNEPQSISAQLVQSFMDLHADPPAYPQEKTPAQSWEMISANIARQGAPEAVEEELSTEETEQETKESPEEPTPRRHWFFSLFSFLKRKKPAQAPVPAPVPVQPEERIAPVEPPAAPAPTANPFASPIITEYFSAPTDSVDAWPEPIAAPPPAEFPNFISEKDLEKSQAPEGKLAVQKVAKELQILPSRRGQYLSRR
jgi:hypothetical protein